MSETAASPQHGLFSLLKILAKATGCKGISLHRSLDQEIMQEVLESFPAGMQGRKSPFSPELLGTLETAGGPKVSSTEHLILPSAITRWLGFRPGFVCSMRCGADTPWDAVFLWWKEAPPTGQDPPGILLESKSLLNQLVGQQAEDSDQDRVRERLDAILANVTLGLVFTDSLRGSRLNAIAAAILQIPAETRDTSLVAEAMTALRSSCAVVGVDAPAANIPGDIETQAEYWINSQRGSALRVESHAMGNAATPARFWVFTDVKPLWESSEKLKSANELLKDNLARLAEEIEKRMQAEAELQRFNRGLRQENAKLEVAKFESDLLANQDALTGLSNRRHFHHAMQDRIAAASVRGDRIAVLFIDLDKFKQVNDTLGHERGDDLLRKVAASLVASLRSEDLIARLGGDEFACATTFAGDVGLRHLAAVTKRVVGALRIPVETASETIRICATVGVAVYPNDAEDVEGLLAAADKAMYLGKREGGDEAVYYGVVGDSTAAGQIKIR